MNNNENRIIGYDPKTGNPIYAHNNYNPNITQNSNYQRQNQNPNVWQNNSNTNNNTQSMKNYVAQNQQFVSHQSVNYNNQPNYNNQSNYNNSNVYNRQQPYNAQGGYGANPNMYNNGNWNNRPVQNVPKKGKISLVKLGATLFAVFIVVVVVLLLVFRNSDGDYYFSNDDYSDFSSNDSNGRSNTGQKRTAIVDDNVYYNKSIGGITDAKKLVVDDSVNQKNSCPSDIVALENEMINKYNIMAVNLCEMDYEFAKGLDEEVFAKLYSEYPEARQFLTNLSLSNLNEKMDDRMIAAFMPVFVFALSDSADSYPAVIKTQVLLMGRYFLDKDYLERSIRTSIETHHFPPNSNIYAPVAHELGHYISFIALLKHYNVSSIFILNASNEDKLIKIMEDFNKGSYSLDIITEAYNRYKKEKGTDLSFDGWRGTISGYALAKDDKGEYIYDETIAESFHDVFVNGDNACDASKYVIKVLKERLRG